jgi:hypothetical protein
MPDALSPETQRLHDALAAARNQTSAAVARATVAEGRLRQETGARFTVEKGAVEASIVATEERQTALEHQIAELNADGKFEDAAKMTRQMSDLSASLVQLRGRKEWIAGQEAHAAAQPVATDPYAQFSESQRRWISENPRYGSDEAFTKKVNAAAGYATEVAGVAPDSKEFFEHVERAAYPERFANQPAGDAGDGTGAGAGGDNIAPTGDAGTGPDIAIDRDHHTLPAQPASQTTTEPPAMRIEFTPEQGGPAEPVRQQPYQPAVGRGNQGDAMRMVAAPPSRNIAAAAQRAAGGGRRAIEPTQEEVDTAIQLAQSIEPESDMVRTNNTREMVQWYYALAHSPTHQHTRRRSWARDSVVG